MFPFELSGIGYLVALICGGVVILVTLSLIFYHDIKAEENKRQEIRNSIYGSKIIPAETFESKWIAD